MFMAVCWLLQSEESWMVRGLSEARPRQVNGWSGGGDQMKGEWAWE